MEPSFAIGQRALLVTHPDGNVLWDCIPLIDDGLAEMVKGMGGISAIAISHPHYYASMVEWARIFDLVFDLRTRRRPPMDHAARCGH